MNIVCDKCNIELDYVETLEFETEAREAYGYDVYTRCADVYSCAMCAEEIEVEYYR